MKNKIITVLAVSSAFINTQSQAMTISSEFHPHVVFEQVSVSGQEIEGTLQRRFNNMTVGTGKVVYKIVDDNQEVHQGVATLAHPMIAERKDNGTKFRIQLPHQPSANSQVYLQFTR